MTEEESFAQANDEFDQWYAAQHPSNNGYPSVDINSDGAIQRSVHLPYKPAEGSPNIVRPLPPETLEPIDFSRYTPPPGPYTETLACEISLTEEQKIIDNHVGNKPLPGWNYPLSEEEE